LHATTYDSAKAVGDADEGVTGTEGSGAVGAPVGGLECEGRGDDVGGGGRRELPPLDSRVQPVSSSKVTPRSAPAALRMNSS
jgi:hypothetical protein